MVLKCIFNGYKDPRRDDSVVEKTVGKERLVAVLGPKCCRKQKRKANTNLSVLSRGAKVESTPHNDAILQQSKQNRNQLSIDANTEILEAKKPALPGFMERCIPRLKCKVST